MLVSPWNTNYPATWSHRLRQFKKTGPLWAERRPPSPLTGTGSTRQGPHTACSIKKRAPASLEPVCFFMVGMARFERAASASRTLRSSQTEPHPDDEDGIYIIKSCLASPEGGIRKEKAYFFNLAGFQGSVPGVCLSKRERSCKKNMFDMILCGRLRNARFDGGPSRIR